MALDIPNHNEIFRKRDVRDTPTSTATATALSVIDATYVTLSLDTDLTNERVLTAGEGIDLTDGGAGSTITLSCEDATSANKGIASFNATDFSVTAGAVTLQTERIQDIAGPLIATGGTKTLITVTYQDATNDMDFVVDNNLANYSNATSLFLTAATVEAQVDHANITSTHNLTTDISHDTITAGTIASHDTTATGANVTTLTDNSMADTLHRHSELSASDGTPDQALVVDATGQVGIGTVSPDTKLDVEVTVATETDGLRIANLQAGGYGEAIRFYSTQQVFDTNTVEAGRIGIVGEANWASAVNVKSSMIFSTVNANSLTEHMRILSGGNVGIGGTNPGTKLEVTGGTMTSIADAQANGAVFSKGGGTLGLVMGLEGGANRPAIQSVSAGTAFSMGINPYGGDVGINTTTPNQPLTVEGTMSLKEQASANADTAAYGQIWVKNTVPNQLWFTDDAGTDFQIGNGLVSSLISGTGVDVSGATGDVTLTTNDGEIVHDNLSGFEANEHIDWTTDQGATNIHAGNYTDTGDTTAHASFSQLDYASAGHTGFQATMTAGEGIDITGVAISGEDATDANKGIASFSATDFTVSSGAVSLVSSPVVSGSYTPTITGVTNIDSTTARVTRYMRIGNSVQVWGSCMINTTSASSATASEVGISLPVASNLANDFELVGHVHVNTVDAITYRSAGIVGDTTNDRAKLSFKSINQGDIEYYFNFTYLII